MLVNTTLLSLNRTLSFFIAPQSVGDVGRKTYPGGDRRYPIFFFKKPDVTEQFAQVSSALSVFESEAGSSVGMDWFINTAQSYLLSGKPFTELCEHNAQVAKRLNRPQVRIHFDGVRLYFCQLNFFDLQYFIEVPP